jgi:hypothetical protein
MMIENKTNISIVFVLVSCVIYRQIHEEPARNWGLILKNLSCKRNGGSSRT